MKVLKICIGTWENASHDKRELSVCRELGAEVEVVAKKDKRRPEGFVDGFYVNRLSARPFQHMPVAFNRIASIFTWASYIRKRKDADVLSCHDLPALLIGYLSNFFKNKKAKLVYDSHEYELGRNKKRNAVQKWWIRVLEGFLIKKSDLVLMVSDCIADEVQRVHRLKKRPYVVRNIPPKWELDFAKAEQIKKMLLEKLSLPEDTCVILYHGGVVRHRGIERLLEAAGKVPGLAVVVLGNGKADYIQQLKAQCVSFGISDRVLFHEAVSMEKLPGYVAAADIGTSLIEPVSFSYIWALPNKLFENIQGLNPLIVSDFPEMGKLVDEYQIGLRVNPEKPEEIAEAIKRLKNDRVLYAKQKENLVQAKEELCWEKEKKKLVEAYRPFLKF